MPEPDDLTQHPCNVRRRETVAAQLERRLRACCRRGYTGMVELKVLLNDGLIKATEVGLNEHQRFND